MRYSTRPPKRRTTRRLLAVASVVVVVAVGATLVVRHVYFDNLRPVSSVSHAPQLITIAKGASVDQIALQLKQAGLIRSTWAFKLYVSSKNVREALEAGTYSLDASQSVAEIVSQLTHGKVATNLVTIIPGQSLAQIRQTLVNHGFKESEVDEALKPTSYPNNPTLVDLPAGASLEGYIYPDSYQKTSSTHPKEVVTAALSEMGHRLTPQLRAAFAQQGLSTYEGIVLASIIEKEVSHPEDRAQVAQVFLKRLRAGIALQSDATSPVFDSYNRRGLPPQPISNVTDASLLAVAQPATTDWLYFVSGDDGVTHFSRTLQEHEANVEQYCHKLCGR